MLTPLAAAKPVSAKPAATTVYTLVEKMPQLPGGGGAAAITQAIQLRVTYPPSALRDEVQGRVYVSFIVATSGQVEQIRVVRGVRTDLDAAVIQAVRQLPPFVPGQQNGRTVAVCFTVPVTFRLTEPQSPKRSWFSW
ncbi:MAG: energy transducer TonB [Janthinobacterium lividum]